MLMQKGANVNVAINTKFEAETEVPQEDMEVDDDEDELSDEDSEMDSDADSNDSDQPRSRSRINPNSGFEETPPLAFLPRHFETKAKDEKIPLFQALVQNDWLGLTFVAMKDMEKFGMSYAKAIEVAFKLKKFQFAKRLIEKQVSVAKLQAKVSKGRNLINALAFECNKMTVDQLLLQVRIPLESS